MKTGQIKNILRVLILGRVKKREDVAGDEGWVGGEYVEKTLENAATGTRRDVSF